LKQKNNIWIWKNLFAKQNEAVRLKFLFKTEIFAIQFDVCCNEPQYHMLQATVKQEYDL
jgi:hypothetical protein